MRSAASGPTTASSSTKTPSRGLPSYKDFRTDHEVYLPEYTVEDELLLVEDYISATIMLQHDLMMEQIMGQMADVAASGSYGAFDPGSWFVGVMVGGAVFEGTSWLLNEFAEYTANWYADDDGDGATNGADYDQDGDGKANWADDDIDGDGTDNSKDSHPRNKDKSISAETEGPMVPFLYEGPEAESINLQIVEQDLTDFELNFDYDYGQR